MADDFTCKGDIAQCQKEFQFLHEKIKTLTDYKLDVKEWYSVKAQISELKVQLKAIADDNLENRETIKKIEAKVDRMEEKFTDVLVSNGIIIEKLEHVIESNNMVLESNKDINNRVSNLEKKTMFNDIKEFMNESKLNKTLGVFVLLIIVIILISSAMFFISGGGDLFGMVEQIVEWISKLKG